MEVDLSAGTQLVYMFPDMVLSIDDFHNHVEVAIQTYGYDTWKRGESNLLVTMAMIAQLDDHLAIQKQKLEMEWENPFAVKRGEDHIVLHFSKNEEKYDDLPYPEFRKFKQLSAQIINKQEEHVFPTATDAESKTSYQPPPDAIIGPALAIKSRKLYFPSTKEKLFAKLPPSLSKKIEESFNAKYPGLSAGVLPAIKFTHTFVSEMCTDAVLAKELRDLSLCSAIPIPGYYKNNMKKYGTRKSRTHKGKLHNSQVKPFKRKYKDDKGRVKKCKCFIYGKEGHFAKDYRSKQGNITRSPVYQKLDLDDNWDIVSADFDNSSVYNISEGEGANFLRSIKGGIQIEGDEITIYKKVTKIKTSNQTEVAEIAELEVSKEEFIKINESIYFNQERSKTLVLSPTKMKIVVPTIDFLGAIIGEGTIKLQPHIIKKIVNFNEEELKTKKGLRLFLRILNYARNHIPKLGILLRPLYETTNAHRDKTLKPSDYELVRKIKEQVQSFQTLKFYQKMLISSWKQMDA
nr:ORFIII-like polyprotein [Tanacetum cinerariifolium]